jgi:DNA-binding NtrC family response regulator
MTAMGRVRTEASVSLTLAWNPCDPIDERDVPVLRRFLAAVRELAGGGQLRVAGDISLLDRAIGVGDVTVADLPVEPGLTRLETQEKHLIITALRRHHGHRVRTAVDVGMGVRTLHNRCRYYGIDPDEFAASAAEVVTA